MIVKLLTEHHLEFLSIKEGCRGSLESTLSKCQIVGNLMPELILIFCFSLGYPDPGYFLRVKEELAVKGVTVDDIAELGGRRATRGSRN